MRKLLVILVVTVTLIGLIATVTYGMVVRTDTMIGYGARADAMGGAFTAVADDGFAPYWNPAGMTQLKALALTGSLCGFPDPELFKDILAGYGGITTRWLAANVNLSAYKNDGSMDSSCNFILSAATPLSGKFKSVSIGANAKMLLDISNNYGSSDFSGHTFSFDMGALIKPSDFLSIGVMVRNLNEPAVIFYDDNGTLYETWIHPRSFTMGLALKPLKSTTLAGDLQFVNKNTYLNLGLEQTALWNSIAVRLGMKSNLSYESTMITGGVGLKILGLYTDLALLNLTNTENMELELSAGFRY